MTQFLSSGILSWVALAIFSLYRLYRIWFMGNKLAGKSAKKAVEKIRIIKATKNQNLITGRKFVKFIIEKKIKSPECIKQIKADMRSYGGVDFELEAGKKMRMTLPIGIISVACLFIAVLFGVSDGISIVTILLFAPTIYLISDTVRLVFYPHTYINAMIKTSTAEIDKHFRDFYNHIYYYYAQDGVKVLLSDVMRTYITTAPKSMQALAKSILADAERSEIEAMQNLRRRYAKSQKICELSNKLEKRISGHNFGKQYMQAMRDSVEEEYDAYMNEQEENKQERYIAIMIGGIGTALLISILACTFVILLSEGVLKI